MSIVVAVAQRDLATIDRWARFAACVADAGVELIFVHAGTLPPREGPENLRVIQCPPGTTIPRLRAAGLRAARGTIVALTEAFCRPGSGWTAALLAARNRTSALAIGGPMTRERGHASAWALTLIEYGRFLRAAPEGEVDDLPMTNVSYERERILAVLDGATTELAEPDVHAAIRTAGEFLWREPDAMMFDDNDVSFRASIGAIYHHGRLFGARRVEGLRWSSRVIRCAMSPAVPFLQFFRIARHAAAAGHTGALVRCSPHFAALLCAWALGEGLGSVLGERSSAGHWS